MGKFDGFLICTDLDGTFAEGTNICGENAKYVKYFQENGGLFTVITGRGPEHLKNFQDFVPNCPVITHQGGVVYDLAEDKVIHKAPISDSVRDVIVYVLGLEDADLRAITLNGLSKTIVVATQDDIDDAEYFKAVFATHTPEAARKIRQVLGEKFGAQYNIFMGWPLGVECLAKGTDKGTAVKKLKEILGDRVQTVICVGDSESDSYMFKHADVGYAVENASQEAKDAADRVTVHFREGAIAQIIKDIESAL